MLKFILGVLLFVGGILLGFYVGFIVCLVGGIVDIVEGFQANPISAITVAWGIAKFFCAATMGYITAFLCIIPGIGLIVTSSK